MPDLEPAITALRERLSVNAARLLPLAANRDATRLMALLAAKTPRRAAHRLAARLHYSDTDHTVLLNVVFPPATHAALEAQAHHAAQTPERFLELAVRRALAERADQETDRLDRAVRQLLAHTLPAYLLSAVGQALTRLPESLTP
ncbi:hypothetical protein [Streptomyces sp. NPDC057253]|uniref:hypothetical protein n=1 Tax=Streptomyces sp. NPDC057253 TaxID=3346069 RepID=UPI00362ED13E